MEWREGNSLHFVYEVRDGAGELLYIGCTGSPEQRERKLRGSKFGWVSGLRIDVIAAFANRRDAYAYELSCIKKFQPPHNQLGKQVAA